MAAPVVHHLTDKDTGARRAECSVCGPVKIQRAGNGWTCSNRANAQNRKQKRDAGYRGSRSESSHKLSWRDPETGTGLCPVCGPTTAVPYGRGWACIASPGAKARVNQQDAPQRHCRDCQVADGVLVWLSADGCPRCAETDLHALLREQEALSRAASSLAGEEYDGMHIVGLADPYAMPDWESAVPRWKTLGSSETVYA